MHRALFTALTLLLAVAMPGAARPEALPARIADHFFLTSDHVRLHYLEAGAPGGRTIVFVPGWTMPAWIFTQQITALSLHYHVVALDPRGQGDSAVPVTGYEPVRRGQDIAEMIAHLETDRVVVVAWSLGVLDTLASIHVAGDRNLAGLVLIDNSVGEEPAPPYHPPAPQTGKPVSHQEAMRAFVGKMFHRPQTPAYLERLTEATLRTPEAAARKLLAYPVPRSYWKEAIYATRVPVLYVIRPKWNEQGQNLLKNRPDTEVDVFNDAGHALFVDDPARFNAVTERFLRQRVWR